MFGAGVWPTMLTSARAAPLLTEGALVACTIAWARDAYLGNSIYDAAKACIARFAFAMAHDLRERGVTAVAVAPGFMRTERVLAAHEGEPFDLSVTESPEYLGRAIAHLAADPARLERTGALLTAGDLARATDSPTSTARSPRRSRFPRDPQDRRHGDVPIASCQLVARPLQHEQLGAGDLARQRFTVARVRTADPRCRG